MTDRWPAATWKDGHAPTVRQLREWLRAFTPEHDARPAADMILGMLADTERAVSIYARLLRLERRKAERFRCAWLSARKGRREAVQDADYWHEHYSGG